MKPTRSALFWAPRLLGIAITLFISIFALDVFGQGYSFGEWAVAFFMHLIPTFVVLAALLIAWRWERIGGALFIFLGLLYIWMFWEPRRSLGYLLISGPLFVTGALFLLNHWLTKTSATTAEPSSDE